VKTKSRFKKILLIVLSLIVLTGILLGIKFQVFYIGPSLDSLQNEYAKQGRIDSKAPIQAHDTIVINASVSKVWQVLSDAHNWPTWFPGVKNVHLSADLAPDVAFTWENGGSKINSTFAVVNPGKELSWTGISFGAKAVDRHVLVALDTNRTRVFNEESMGGPLLTLFYSSKILQTDMKHFLHELKLKSETTK
jgi:uncharacterized protein YndB with AHSA1/START domain